MTITVANKRHGAKGIYVARPAALGNPYRIGPDGTREEVIIKYEAWLRRQLASDSLAGQMFDDLLRRHLAGEDLVLVCWCKRPDREVPCHADVIRRFLEVEGAGA